MKISLNWLQSYFAEPLPNAETIADAYTFHAFEIDEMRDDLMDVKVLPNRAADCLSHRGLAKELSAILDVPLAKDPLAEPLPIYPAPQDLSVHIEDEKKCARYMGAVVRGVKVGPSPVWLKEALESVGQRSINNVVDATNYVMLNIGQPLHAFDANKIDKDAEGRYTIEVRDALVHEGITDLSGNDHTLEPGMLVIGSYYADKTPDGLSIPNALGIAGIKGGQVAEVTPETTDLVIEAANFDGTSVRRTAQKLKLSTDASHRFQSRPSPELAAYGMRDVLALITEIAGGHVEGVADVYPLRQEPASVIVTLSRINGLLGSSFSGDEVAAVFRRLGLHTERTDEVFTVTPPFERTDLTIPENLVEEVGRILGYDRIAPLELPQTSEKPDQARYRGMERMKDQLVEQGFIEVSTQSFAKSGDIELANPLDKSKPALRTMLKENLDDALAKAKLNAPLVLPPKAKPKLFEIGTVFPRSGEFIELRMTEPVKEWGTMTTDNLTVAKLEEYGSDYEPMHPALGDFVPFSMYPFITRDISLWIPDTDEDRGNVLFGIFKSLDDGLIRHVMLLDQFKKDGRNSLAFRLVFQSFERTLTDEEVNAIMERIYAAVREAGYDVR